MFSDDYRRRVGTLVVSAAPASGRRKPAAALSVSLHITHDFILLPVPSIETSSIPLLGFRVCLFGPCLSGAAGSRGVGEASLFYYYFNITGHRLKIFFDI
jgi:hypothetical protein